MLAGGGAAEERDLDVGKLLCQDNIEARVEGVVHADLVVGVEQLDACTPHVSHRETTRQKLHLDLPVNK